MLNATLLLVLGWTVFGLVDQALATRRAGLRRERWQPYLWRLGGRNSEELRRCLTRVEPALPADQPVQIFGHDRHGFVWHFAAYSLPTREVLPITDVMPPDRPVVALAPDRPPKARRVFGTRRCGVYRAR